MSELRCGKVEGFKLKIENFKDEEEMTEAEIKKYFAEFIDYWENKRCFTYENYKWIVALYEKELK